MASLTPSQIERIDRSHTWHPYSSVDSASTSPCWQVVSAEGVRLTLADGRQLIDGMASWWSVMHGYNHPHVNQAVTQQLGRMAHVMFGGLCHEPAAQLIQTLVDITPVPLQKVFLADSGSVSVEVALKMAIQYWHSKGQPNKNKILSLRNGYHGDTFGAMSVCDPVTGMHHLFAESLQQNIFSEAPQCGFDSDWDEKYIQDFAQKIEQHQQSLAAVILEPIVQGAGGMRFYSPHYLKRVRELCDQHNVLLIADEIATGFGRTGKLFACEWANVCPDILCVGKAMTGGYMTLAATLCTDKIAQGICQGEAGVFMHGPTFMGNPLACSAANANLELLLNNDWQANIERLQRGLEMGLSPCRDLSSVADVRVLGGIGVVEMKQAVTLAEIQPQFVDAGIWLRPFGKLIYTMPPYIISDADLGVLTEKIVEVVCSIE
ncbi:adenosylmethionine--8-amino-7-oxononanoate transaminase [bacterium SCSIO 12696]|nr:adenosylmethionine--8-amino-7-oxononanoate transaminase [bacterium SCSIO 12696]